MNRNQVLTLILSTLFLFWLAFVLASLYAIQKPFTASTGAALAGTTWNLLAVGLLFGIATALGRRVLRAVRLAIETRLERVLFAAGIGLGIISLLVLAIGLAGLLYRSVLLPLFLAGTLYLVIETFLILRRGALRDRVTWPRPPLWLLIYAGLMVLMTLLVALSPPLGWDSLFYHLTGPKLVLEAGRIMPGIDVPHFNFPGFSEMLFTLLLAIAGDGATAPLHLGYGILTGAAVYALTRRWFGQSAAWMSLAVWVSMPMVFVLAGWAYNDLALVFYQTLALIAVLQWRDRRETKWLTLAGIALGLEMGLKYVSAMSALAIGILVLWQLMRGRVRFRTAIRSLITFALPALLIASPWYLKSLAFTGNLFYPFLFGGRFWDAFRAGWYGRPGTGLGWDIGQLLMLPWTAVVGIRDANFYDGQMGPVFLTMLPVVMLYPIYSRLSRQRLLPAFGPLLWVAAFLGASWTAGVINSRPLFQSRLLLPCLTAVTPLIGFLILEMERFSRRSLSLRRLVTWSLILVLGLNSVTWMGRLAAVNPLPVLVGAESRQAFLERNLGLHAIAMEELNRRLPAASKTLFLWEPRSYYCDRDVQPDSILDTWAHLVYLYGDADAIAAALRDQGFTHIMLHRHGMDFIITSGLDPITSQDLEAWDSLVNRHLREIEWPACLKYELYELLPASLSAANVGASHAGAVLSLWSPHTRSVYPP